MPKITPARPDAHPPHADSDSEFGTGSCLACYEAGFFTLAADPAGRVCVIHGALSAAQNVTEALGSESPPSAPAPTLRRSRPRRGRAAREPAPPDRPPARPSTDQHAATRRLIRAKGYGRRRAAIRAAAPGYTPHPGWRHLIAPGWRVLDNQAEALALVQDLVDDQDWRADKRAAWSAILRQLVCAMDWGTGLIAALTAQRLGAAGDRAPRTVSRVIAWARDIGLIVTVEHGASAEFLGTDHGRTPTYALVTNSPLPQPPAAAETEPDLAESGQLTTTVEESGDPPKSLVENKPLNSKRLEPTTTPAAPSWPVFGIPESAPDRTAAAQCLLRRLGLDRGGVPQVPLWRTRALLRTWWNDGACPAGLLWAIDHHPDNPNHHRGDALRGTRDPLRVLGARLRPWRGRLSELPARLAGLRGDYVAAQQERLAADVAAHEANSRPAPRQRTPAQVQAQAAVAEHFRQLRTRRSR